MKYYDISKYYDIEKWTLPPSIVYSTEWNKIKSQFTVYCKEPTVLLASLYLMQLAHKLLYLFWKAIGYLVEAQTKKYSNYAAVERSNCHSPKVQQEIIHIMIILNSCNSYAEYKSMILSLS